jgi:hypothetical protein
MTQIEMFTSTEDTQLTTLTSLTKLTWKQRNPESAWATDAVKNAKLRAAKKGLPFDLTVAYVKDILSKHCPVFGTEFKYRGNLVPGDLSPSLDRIVPSKGYVQGNVVIISSKANNIKSAYKSTDIFKVAQWLQSIENKG